MIVSLACPSVSFPATMKFYGARAALLCVAALLLQSSFSEAAVTATRRHVAEAVLKSNAPQTRILNALRSESRIRSATQYLQFGTPESRMAKAAAVANESKGLLMQLPVPPVIKELTDKVAKQLKTNPEEIQGSLVRLNSLILEEKNYLDRKVIECKESIGRSEDAAAKAAREVRSYAMQISADRATVAKTAGELPQLTEDFESWSESLRFSEATCKASHDRLRKQSEGLQKDDIAMASIKMSAVKTCGEAGFLQLSNHSSKDACLDGKAQPGKVLLLSTNIAPKASLRPGLRQKLQAALLRQRTAVLVSHLRRAVTSTQSPGPRVGNLRSTTRRLGVESSQAQLDVQPLPVQCNLGKQVCAAMVDAVDEVIGEITDSQAEVLQRLQDDTQSCGQDQQEAKSMMGRGANSQGQMSTRLASASASMGSAVDQKNQKEAELKGFDKTWKEEKERCHAEIQASIYDKLCGLQRLRDELVLLGGASELPEDCEVTDWVEAPCSSTCGGGTRTLTREVWSPAYKGADCQALSMVQKCGETACPVDCTVSEWEGWSKCTAPCDGGIQQRLRVVETEATNDGDVCPEISQTRICNPEDCTKDCELARWTAWSRCSQACGGGVMFRSRPVAKPEVGGGQCPHEDAPERSESKSCNTHACPAEFGLQCIGQAKDVVILVDTSGSLASEESFEMLKALVSELSGRYVNKTVGGRVAVVGFANEAKVVSGFTDDLEVLHSHISSKLTWTQGASRLGQGLTMAKVMLSRDGRADSVSTVLALTDGRLSDPFNSRHAAKQLKELGRLVVVPLVSGNKVGSFARLVSSPWRNNIIEAAHTTLTGGDMLDVMGTTRRVVLSTCADVALPPTNATAGFEPLPLPPAEEEDMGRPTEEDEEMLEGWPGEGGSMAADAQVKDTSDPCTGKFGCKYA